MKSNYENCLHGLFPLKASLFQKQETLKEAEQFIKSTIIDIIFCDVRCRMVMAIEFIKTIKEKFPSVEIILLTAYGNIADGIQAIKNGAFDYMYRKGKR